MNLTAPCSACGLPVTAASGCWFLDTETASPRRETPFFDRGAQWGIAHAACLPREDYGDGEYDTVWTLYAPDMPSTTGALASLVEHIAEKRWAQHTDLFAFVLEATTGTGRWQVRENEPAR